MDAIEVTVMMVLLVGTAAGLVTLGRRFWWHPSTGPVTVSARSAGSAADGTQGGSRRGWLPVVLAVATLLLLRRRRRRRRAKDCRRAKD